MHTLRLKVQDNVFDKIMYFLQNLPKNEVEVIEEKTVSKVETDFIAFLSSNPFFVNSSFRQIPIFFTSLFFVNLFFMASHRFLRNNQAN